PRCAITKEEVKSKHYSSRSVPNNALPVDNHSHGNHIFIPLDHHSVHHDGIGGMTNDLQETEGLDLSTIRSADFFFNKAVITEETDFYNHSTLNSDKENKSAMAIENALPLTKFSQQIRPENGNNATDEEGEYRVDKTSLHDENATITSFGVESSISYKSDGDDAQHTTKAMAAVPLEPPQEIEQVLEHFRLQAVPVLNSSQPAASAKLTTG
uniref:Uncharacterized protein n=1 Tax=Parascaris equorum TaxID=6256 RepID=A0A914SGY0_PAREQ